MMNADIDRRSADGRLVHSSARGTPVPDTDEQRLWVARAFESR